MSINAEDDPIKFLEWIKNRLENIYGETEYSISVIGLNKIIEDMKKNGND